MNEIFRAAIVFSFMQMSLVNAAEKANTKVSYEKKTHLDFEEKSVDGEFLRPDGQAIQADKNTEFDSLINPRANFNKEIKRSAGAIR